MRMVSFLLSLVFLKTYIIMVHFKAVNCQSYSWDSSGVLRRNSGIQTEGTERFNDPEYRNQLYLNEKTHITMNIQKVWKKKITGKNVTICIVDPTGVDYSNAELQSRFVHDASFNFDFNVSDTSPYRSRAPNGHGTEMAGLAAAEANNGECGVGVAYQASISAVKINFQDVSEATSSYRRESKFVTADALSFKNNINDIYSCSWGMADFYQQSVSHVPQTIKIAMKNAAEKGRNGKGNILVFATGNQGIFNGTCSYSEYISSIYTIGISVVTGKNVMSRQNMPCAGTSAVVYSRDGTLGFFNRDDAMPTCTINNRCTTSGSSSAAAAVASGIMALVLQANPNLGWRDMQHLIARSSCSKFDSVQWKTNGAGIRVSDGFGFGLLDADALVENARSWTNAGPQLSCKIDFSNEEYINNVKPLRKSIDLNSWPESCGGEYNSIGALEHVQIIVSLNFTLRKHLEIEIESPSGTHSVFLRSGRFYDKGSEINDLSILSLHYWGENPKGIWKMKLRSVTPHIPQEGKLLKWSLVLYGSRDDPMKRNTHVKKSDIDPSGASRKKKVRPAQRGCKDEQISSVCKNWKLFGFCRHGHRFRNVMRKSCKQTCGFCKGADTCKDERRLCRYYKRKGYCASHFQYMNKNCKKTCGFCKVNPCANHPCRNGGTCTTTHRSFVCKCRLGYRGALCTERDPCASNPCQDGGRCVITGRSFSCTCPYGYTGKTCTKVNPCADNPCHNGGTCTATEGFFVCNCAFGYHGTRCTEPINQCKNTEKHDRINCPAWEESGFCRKGSQYHGFMKDHCKKSCGFC